jgi:methionyl-tRNA synthetase
VLHPHWASAAPAPLQRLQGKRVRFVTGTDEHGEKIALAAAKRGMAPQG